MKIFKIALFVIVAFFATSELSAQSTGTKRTRSYLRTKFQTAARPSQTDYYDWQKSFFHLDEDSLYFTQIRGIDTMTTSVTLTGATHRQLASALAIKTYVDNAVSSAGGSVSDGDKGDITVSSSGATWNIDADAVGASEVATGAIGTDEIANGAVSNTDLATMTTGTFKGNVSGSTASPSDLTVSQVKTALAIQTTDLSDFAEAVEDKIGAKLVAGSNVTISYNDGTGETTIAASGGGGLTDGDKGDITVSASGATWNIDAGVVGTTEIADNSVTSAKIPADAVTATQIVADGVGSSEIAANAVGASEVTANAIGNSEMDDNAVGSAEIIDESIQAGDIDTSAVTTSEILNGTIVAADLGQMSATSGQVMRWNGSAWAASNVTLTDGDYGDITASSSGSTLVVDNGTITSAKIANGGVALIDLANDATISGNANTAGDTLTNGFQKILLDVDAGSIATRANATTTQRTAANAFNVMLANATSSTGSTFTPDLSAANVFRHTVSSGSTLSVANATNNAGGRVGNVFRTLLKNSSGGSLTVSFGTTWLEQDWTQASNLTLANNDSVILDWKSEFKGGSYVLTAMSDLGGSGGGGTVALDTIMGGYPSLRAVAGSTLSDVVLVLDWTYTYSGTSYSSIGGFFRKGSVGLAENGGTVIVANDGTRWVRVFDGVTYRPDWWEVGGKNVSGQAIAYIATDCMRMDACSRTAGEGATIILSGRVVSDCDQSFSTQQGQKWIGQNCESIIRAKTVEFSMLTGNANAGATTMTVADTTGFRIGKQLLLRKQRGYSSSLQNAVTITSKTGLTITFTPALSNNFNTNDTVVVVNRLIQASGTSSMKSLPITFEGIEFDCNWRSRRYVNSWSYNEVMEASSFNVYFNNCNFVNTSASCVFMGKGELNNCRFGAACTNSPATEKRMAGGLAHGSNSSITEHHTYTYRNCVSDSTNQVSPSIIGHESALFNFSSNNAFFTVDGGSYRNGGGGILWSDNNDWKFSVTGNTYFKNFTSIIRSSTASGASNSQGDIIVEGGLYEDCGDVVFTTVDATRYRNITVRNMRVFNGRIMLNGINQLRVENNHFVERRTVVGTSPFSTDLGAFASLTTRSMCWVQKCSNVDIIGNVFVADSIYNINVAYGIHFTPTGMTTINSGRDYFEQNINVSGNTLRNFRYGIGTQFGGINTAETVRRVNWRYTNNSVTTQSHTAADGFGIHVAPGVVATGNVIYDMNSDANSYGLIVAGVDDSGPNETIIEGGIAHGNTVLGRSGTNILVGAGTSTVNEHNALCFNNVSLTAPVNNTSNSSPNLPNIVLDATIAPTLSGYQTPLFLNFR